MIDTKKIRDRIKDNHGGYYYDNHTVSELLDHIDAQREIIKKLKVILARVQHAQAETDELHLIQDFIAKELEALRGGVQS